MAQHYIGVDRSRSSWTDSSDGTWHWEWVAKAINSKGELYYNGTKWLSKKDAMNNAAAWLLEQGDDPMTAKRI